MGDLDCNCDGCDFGDCDCDCCGGCEMDCDPNCGSCCPDQGFNNVIFCCFLFPPPSDDMNARKRNHRNHSSPDCSPCFCCCMGSEPSRRSMPRKNPENPSRKRKRKGILSCLCPCFTGKTDVSSPPHSQSKVQQPSDLYKQEGRYPMPDHPGGRYPMPDHREGRYSMPDHREGRYPMADNPHIPPRQYLDHQGNVMPQELNRPHGDYKMYGQWSKPTLFGIPDDKH